MADSRFCRLAQRGVMNVGGADRATFLQGLISNDIAKAGPGRAMWAGFLTPQGKFLYDLFVAEQGDRFVVDVEAGRAEEFRKKLSIYKLRAKVEIAPAEGWAVYAAWGGDCAAALGLGPEAGAAVAFAGGVAFTDPRLAAAGIRLVLPEAGAAAALAKAGLTEASFAAWDEHRIRLGLPDGGRDVPVDRGVLLEYGFDELNGVDFNKGCYLGQELTSRTKHRGLVRKRLMPVTIDGPAPEAGTPLLLGEAEAGEMRSSAGQVGLALVRLELFRAAATSQAAFTAGTARLSPARPDWAVFPEGE